MKRFVLVVLLLFSVSLFAADKKVVSAAKPAPKKAQRTKWEAPIKDPNNPNEVMQVKWDAIAKVLTNKELDQKAREKAINGYTDRTPARNTTTAVTPPTRPGGRQLLKNFRPDVFRQVSSGATPVRNNRNKPIGILIRLK